MSFERRAQAVRLEIPICPFGKHSVCGLRSEAIPESTMTVASGDEIGDHFRHSSDLLGTKFRIHGQRNHFVRGVLRVWKISGLVAERGIQRLQMKWHGIVDSVANILCAQNLLQ